MEKINLVHKKLLELEIERIRHIAKVSEMRLNNIPDKVIIDYVLEYNKDSKYSIMKEFLEQYLNSLIEDFVYVQKGIENISKTSSILEKYKIYS